MAYCDNQGLQGKRQLNDIVANNHWELLGLAVPGTRRFDIPEMKLHNLGSDGGRL
jgi:hypothetical protein